MKQIDDTLHTQPEASIKAVLNWLAQTSQQLLPEDAEQLHRQIQIVRATPIPTAQRRKLLDLLYSHTERLVHAELPELHSASLPVSRRIRQRVRGLQDLLETLAQDYLNTLSELFDPQAVESHHAPQETLTKALRCMVWNIRISHLVASPTALGQWTELHSTFNTARQLGLITPSGNRQPGSLEHLYLCALLVAIAQPASFNSHELEFIAQCIESIELDVQISNTPPLNSEGVFWIDPKTDFPAYAIVRRAPPPEIKPWFFSCKNLAREIRLKLNGLLKGNTASSLNLPILAESPTGQGVLRRLVHLWGEPGKRRFTRRRQSYRAKMCIGLEQIHRLLHASDAQPAISEWMVINESPDGYAIMHMSGETGHVQAGDIVALQSDKEKPAHENAWLICIVRWAISENPEHIELGLQLLAAHATVAFVAQAKVISAGTIPGLLLPENPPLRTSVALIVSSGQLSTDTGKLIVLLEQDNLAIREFRPTRLDEQTNRIEVFSLEPDETV